MFKEYKGFDLEVLKKGMAVHIEDTKDAKTGNWLVQEVTREKIKLIKYNSMEYEISVKEFLIVDGKMPRLKMTIIGEHYAC